MTEEVLFGTDEKQEAQATEPQAPAEEAKVPEKKERKITQPPSLFQN